LGVRLLVFNHQGHPISRQRCCPVTNVLMFLRINHRITDYCSRGYARVHQLCTQEGHRSTRPPPLRSSCQYILPHCVAFAAHPLSIWNFLIPVLFLEPRSLSIPRLRTQVKEQHYSLRDVSGT
jgi:hypothetical protein